MPLTLTSSGFSTMATLLVIVDSMFDFEVEGRLFGTGGLTSQSSESFLASVSYEG